MMIEVTDTGYYNATAENKVMLLRSGSRFNIEERIKIKTKDYYRCVHPDSKQGFYVEVELVKTTT
jgi:hypothetical protein